MRRLLLPLLTALLLVPGSASAQEGPPPADVTLSYGDDGRTVHVRPGQQVEVVLATAYDSRGTVRPLEGFDGLPTLQLLRLQAGGRELRARFQAVSAGRYGGRPEVRPQQLRAEVQFGCVDDGREPCAGDRRPWSVQLVVDEGPAATGPVPCRPVAHALPSPRPGSAVATAADDGGTVRLEVGGSLQLLLGSCEEPFPLPPLVQSPEGRQPLVRGSVDLDRSGGTLLVTFSASVTGTATVRAPYDARCAHRTGPDGVAECAPPSGAYGLTVEVVERSAAPCPASRVTLAGPSRAAVGSQVRLSGGAAAGEQVEVLFRRRGQQAFTVGRTLRTSDDGTFSTSFAAADDHRWYARTRCSSSEPGLTQAAPVVTGPALVRRGSTVTLAVRAVAGVRTHVFFRGAGQPFSARRALDGSGTVTYTAASDQRWYALTRDVASAPGLTRVR